MSNIAEALATSVRDLWSAVAEEGIDRPERIVRASRAAEAQQALDGLASSVSPYASGHSLLADMLVVGDPAGARMAGFVDEIGAKDRLQQYRVASVLADHPGLVSKGVATAPGVPTLTGGLLGFAVPPAGSTSANYSGGRSKTETTPRYTGTLGQGAGEQTAELGELPSAKALISGADTVSVVTLSGPG